MADHTTALDAITLLAPLDGAARARLAGQCAWREVAQGETIFDRDSGGHDVLFITRGAVGVFNYSRTGHEVAFATLSAGDYLGELSAIDGGARSAAIVALTDCRLAMLPRAAFRRLLADHPDMAWSVLRRLAGMVRALDDRVMDLTTLSALQRVYRQIQHMTQEAAGNAAGNTDGDGVRIERLPAHARIASLAGTTRETVARALSHLTATGIASRAGRGLVIAEPRALQSLIDGMSAHDHAA